jgi:hypothetical protein
MSDKTQSVNDIEKLKTDFKKIINDFSRDLLITFPELEASLSNLLEKINGSDEGLDDIYNYCKQVFPERFFDILYQNVDIFQNDEINTQFLPNVEFKELWKCDITDKTRETMWKYLQLTLFTIITDISNGECFGNASKMFEAIDENEFKAKLEETFENIRNVFDASGMNLDPESMGMNFNDVSGNGINFDGLPNAQQMHDHISSMMGGKLGQLAQEIAEETAADLNLNMENASSMNDVFQNLFKNPGKLMGLVKNVGDKLDRRIKSGEIKESELLQEANDIVQRMKDMPGMDNIQEMLSKMGLPNLNSKHNKVNMGAVQSRLNSNIKLAKTKERMKQKVQHSSPQQASPSSVTVTSEQQEKEATLIKLLNSGSSNEIENLIFSTGEKMEKSVRPASAPSSTQNKKKKNKK